MSDLEIEIKEIIQHFKDSKISEKEIRKIMFKSKYLNLSSAEIIKKIIT